MTWNEREVEWPRIKATHFEDAECGGWTCRDCGAHIAADGPVDEPELPITTHYASHATGRYL